MLLLRVEPPRITVACDASHVVAPIDTWLASCHIRNYQHTVWHGELPLAIPATRHEAMAAIERFFDHDQYRILAEHGYRVRHAQ